MHILLADDEKVVIQPLARLLEKLGNSVACAHNGEEALLIIENQRVDLLISDIRMPQMDGVRLMQASRNLKPNLPIILMAGYIEDEMREKVAWGGLCRLLPKPIDLEILLTTIKEMEQ